MLRKFFWIAILCTASLQAKETICLHSSLNTLYNSLDPHSVSQHFAFYELYSETEEGKTALKHAWALLAKEESLEKIDIAQLPKVDVQSIISLITRQPFETQVILSKEQCDYIRTLGNRLGNRQLKGFAATTKEEVLKLPSDEIDIARALLLFQFDEEAAPMDQYEAMVDLMALQIDAYLPLDATYEDKIREINRFIFQEMQFRFPPHSLYATDIDLYTFLPSILDSRHGVCLGVSILYLSLAQRLNLPLEIITPPGHIYVRYNNGKKIINIETTARGVDMPSETYLGINTRKLQQRKVKEVVGLAFMNQAAVFWEKQDFKTTLALYEKAALFVPDDPLLKMFLGFQLLFNERKREGVKLLKEISRTPFEEAVSAETIPEDYLNGKIDIEGIKAAFLPVDETRESILNKQKKLQQILTRYPQYRAGLLQLATTWLQLGRNNEAKQVLERYHKLDPHYCIVEYYLTVLSLERLDYTLAWHYFNQTESLLNARNHHPKLLFSLKKQLRIMSPQ